MESVTGNPEVGDAAFWGTSSYRSGGVDWREFLDIDDGDESGFTEPHPTDLTPETPAVAPTSVELASRRVELSELAATTSEAFGSWSDSPDDLLPSR